MFCRVFRSVRFFPPGFLCPKAHPHFFLRGNWSVDLQAGSEFGYKLLFVILLAGLFAVILQVLSSAAISRCQVILIHLSKGPGM
jgi:metal iron transporter